MSKGTAAVNLISNVAEDVPFVGGVIGGGRVPFLPRFRLRGTYQKSRNLLAMRWRGYAMRKGKRTAKKSF